MTFRASRIDSCCGAILFANFGGMGTNYSVDQKADLVTMNDWLDTNEKHQRDRMGMAFAFLFINDAQMDQFGEVFKKRGYNFTGPFFHPKERTRLYVGTLGLQEDPGEEIVPMYKDGQQPKNYGKSDREVRQELYVMNEDGDRTYERIRS